MPFPTVCDDHLPRRNARSLDLDDSAAKAAAWVWHLHTSNPGVTTEGRAISPDQIRRRSSSNYDRKATRFRQEASLTPHAGASGSKTGTLMWDCGSNLYDSFELVSFGDRLDRSLMEAVPITARQADCQEHHMKPLLQESRSILRTYSVPRSLAPETRKSHIEVASLIPSSSTLSESKPSKSDKRGAEAKSFKSLAQSKASTKWDRVRSFINVIKKVVVLHRKVDLMGCKRSITVVESSQRPLNPTCEMKDGVCARGNGVSMKEELRANLSLSTLNEGECLRPRIKGGGNYKLSISSKDKSKCERNTSNSVEAYSSSASYDGGLLPQLLPRAKIRSFSESMGDAFSAEHKKSRHRRKSMEDRSVFLNERIKGNDSEGINVKERIRGADYEKTDHFKHLHHHHHHHHHHHYVHHDTVSESARLSCENKVADCEDQSWLI